MNHIIAIHKPSGMKSHDVIDQVRKITGIKKVGHGGTLDPFASGVLVIAIGREYTKQLDAFVKGGKEYIAKIMLGFHSTTDDRSGELTPASPPEYIIDSNMVSQAVNSFIGDVTQIPPKYSALKIKGTPAHRRIRRRENFEMEARQVKIYDIETISYQYPYINLRVVTGPGVYIRALARDIGEKLSTGAYLDELQRTRVNNFTIDEALTLEEFKNEWIANKL